MKKNNNIIIHDEKKVDIILDNIKKGGVNNLHFLADFDNTLTKAFVNGKKSASMVAVLRGEDKLLGDDCAREEEELFSKYHPIEFDPNYDLDEKKVKMVEWWTKSLELFVKYGLKLDLLRKIAQTDKIQLRDGAGLLLKKLSINNVPLIIISASGFGKKSIEYFLEYRNLFFDNTSIVSNDLVWDNGGLAVDYKKPIIHSFNKDETVLEEFPEIHDKIINRKNVILLGDSMGDHHMVDGFEYDSLLKIGFLNYKESENIDAYKQRYDIIVTGDDGYDFLNKYLEEFLT